MTVGPLRLTGNELRYYLSSGFLEMPQKPRKQGKKEITHRFGVVNFGVAMV